MAAIVKQGPFRFVVYGGHVHGLGGLCTDLSRELNECQ